MAVLKRFVDNVSANPAPLLQQNFTKLVPDTIVGPVAAISTAAVPITLNTGALSQAIAITTKTQTVVSWETISAFDNDLRSALKDFIDTNKEGVVALPSLAGRSKKLDFTFIGSPSNTISPGEIGSFILEFSYPPNT